MKLLFENWRNFLHEEKQRPRNFTYNYALSELGGSTIDQRSGHQSTYGASMNKPILAFVNLILAKEGKVQRRLTPSELDKLISYVGDERGRQKSTWSNKVNRALSKSWPRFRKHRKSDPEVREDPKLLGKKSTYPISAKDRRYYQNTSKEVGVTHDAAVEVLERFGLAQDLPAVRWGSNRQSPEGYNRFMSLLTNISSDPNHEHWNEAMEILKYTKKRQGGTPGKGLQKYLNKELEKMGYGKDAIKTMYGKGGKEKTALNYSLILNNRYVLSLYTKAPAGAVKLADWRKGMHEITLDTIMNNLTPDNLNVPTVEMPDEDIHIEPPTPLLDEIPFEHGHDELPEPYAPLAPLK